MTTMKTILIAGAIVVLGLAFIGWVIWSWWAVGRETDDERGMGRKK